MRKGLLWALCSLLVLGMNAQDNRVPGELMIQLSGTTRADEWMDDHPEVSSEVIIPDMNLYLLRTAPSITDSLYKVFLQDPDVIIVQYHHYVEIRQFPDDPFFMNQWNFYNDGSSGGVVDADIDLELAWDLSTGGWTTTGDTIVVAVVDDEFSIPHNDLRFRKNHDEIPGNGIDDDGNGYVDDHIGYNVTSGNDEMPVGSHGTHITGIIGAKGDNFLGVAGMNWYMEVLPVSIGNGPVLESNVLLAYEYVRAERKRYDLSGGEEGSFIVATNSSFGIDFAQPDDFPVWCAMYDSLGQLGILNSAATANMNINVDAAGDMPTGCPSNFIIAVNNINKNDEKSSSAFGEETIDMGAPGALVYSTVMDNAYAYQSGTSMAAPHVAGAVALLMSYACEEFIDNFRENPPVFAAYIKDFLMQGVDPIPDLDGITVTGGRLNVYNAMLLLDDFCMDMPASINESGSVQPLVFPNPVHNHLVLAHLPERNDILFTFADIRGRVVLSGSLSPSTQSTQTIPVHELVPGAYVLGLRTGDGRVLLNELIVVE